MAALFRRDFLRWLRQPLRVVLFVLVAVLRHSFNSPRCARIQLVSEISGAVLPGACGRAGIR